jgi:hypothetical protein
MRTNFSPTSAAARMLATRPTPSKHVSESNPPMEPRSCEWPRRAPAAAPRGGIWQALRAIQARHA